MQVLEKNVENLVKYNDVYNCPLIDRLINQGECMDIRHVHGRLMKMDELVPKFDFEKADELCHNCPYNQMR